MTTKQKKFIDILFRALQRSDLGTFDYLSFRKKLKEYQGLSEEERYQQAFKEAGGWSAGTENARKTIEAGVEALIGETDKFKGVLQKQKIEKVEVPHTRMAQIKEDIQRKQREIETLKKEYITQKEQAEEAQQTIRQTASDFQEAYQQLVNQVRGDLEKINQYLSDK